MTTKMEPRATLPTGYDFASNGPREKIHISGGHGTGICGTALRPTADKLGNAVTAQKVCKWCLRAALKKGIEVRYA